MNVSLAMMFGRSGAIIGNLLFPILMSMRDFCFPPFGMIGATMIGMDNAELAEFLLNAFLFKFAVVSVFSFPKLRTNLCNRCIGIFSNYVSYFVIGDVMHRIEDCIGYIVLLKIEE